MKFPKAVFTILGISLVMYTMRYSSHHGLKNAKLEYYKLIIIPIDFLVVYLQDAYVGFFIPFLVLIVSNLVLFTISSIISMVFYDTPNLYSWMEFYLYRILMRVLHVNVVPFAGSHFDLPLQDLWMDGYIVMDWWCSLWGQLAAQVAQTYLPTLSSCGYEYECTENITYFKLSLAILSAVLVLIFRKMYNKARPEKNPFKDLLSAFRYAKRRQREIRHGRRRRRHTKLIDLARERYDDEVIEEMTRLQLYCLIIPWGMVKYVLKLTMALWPRQVLQMQWNYHVNAKIELIVDMWLTFMLIFWMPILKGIVMPALKERNFFVKELQVIYFGILLFSISTFCFAGMWLYTDSLQLKSVSPGEVEIRIYNPTDCDLSIKTPETNVIKIKSLQFNKRRFKIKSESLKFRYQCDEQEGEAVVPLKNQTIVGICFQESGDFYQFLEKFPTTKYPHVKYVNNEFRPASIKLLGRKSYNVTYFREIMVDQGIYRFVFNGTQFLEKNLRLGGIYVVMVQFLREDMNIVVLEVKRPNSITIYALVPFTIIFAFAVIIVETTMRQFAYKEAPKRLKSTGYYINGGSYSLGLILTTITLEMMKIISIREATVLLLCGFLLLAALALTVLLTYRYYWVRPLRPRQSLQQ